MMHPVQPEWIERNLLAFCSRCSAVILTDDEGSNAAAHEAEHARTDEIAELLHRLAKIADTQRRDFEAHAHGQDNAELTSGPVPLRRPARAIERASENDPDVFMEPHEGLDAQLEYQQDRAAEDLAEAAHNDGGHDD